MATKKTTPTIAKAKPKKVTKKTVAKTPEKEPQAKKPAPSKPRSKFYAVGRRKESVARVYYYVSSDLEIIVNGKPYTEIFSHIQHKKAIEAPFDVTGWNKGKWMIRVIGGGKIGQAESVRLGISRLLTAINEEFRSPLKKSGFLTRDPRVKERKKYGLKRARRAPQWQKR